MKEFVCNGTDPLKRVLLCPPTYHEFEPINVITEKWLDEKETVNHEKCMAEHQLLIDAYEKNGVKVELMDPKPGLHYEVFARDFGGCVKEGYIMGSFREPCRQAETAEYEKKMKELGIPVIARCTSGAFEGGDFWMLDDYTIAHGIIARTDRDGFENVKRQVEELGYTMVGVPCARRNLHLDMCFNIVAEKVAVVCEEALPEFFINMLKKRNFTLIPIPQEGVFKHFGNLQALGNGKVLTLKQNVEVNQKMCDLGLETIELDITEILKGGGGLHCMTFPLERHA